MTEQARADYAANNGDAETVRHRGRIDPSLGDDPNWGKEYQSSGIAYERSHLQMAHVRDGASNTYLVGEKYLNPDHYATGDAKGDDQSMYCGFNNDNHRVTHPNYPPRQDTPGEALWHPFGSAHTAGFQMSLCDGSVRLIPYAIDLDTHRRLGNRHDGEVIDGGAL